MPWISIRMRLVGFQMINKIILIILLSAIACFAGDSISVTQPGTITLTQPSVILNQTQFQRIVSDKQQLKTDSIIVKAQIDIITNMQKKDSLSKDNLALSDTILNKYKSLYEEIANKDAKLEAPSFWDSKIIWFILGLVASYFGAEQYHLIK